MKRLMALSTAEAKQFFRNATLVIMVPLPVLMALFVMTGDSSRFGVSIASAMLLLTNIGFVVYYSSLSMATTRRDEKVLKRLRTGEARDAEILSSVAAPTAILVAVITPVGIAVINAFSDDDLPAMTNAFYVVAATVLGIIFCHALALITSRFTKNAEAAMITSFPVLILLIVSITNGPRNIMSDALRIFVDWNPFALAADIFVEGLIGQTRDNAALALAALAAWAVILTFVAHRWMRWETDR